MSTSVSVEMVAQSNTNVRPYEEHVDRNIEKQMAHARQHLAEGEVPIEVVFGTYETTVFGSESIRNGIFIATDRRVLLFGKKLFGFELESFPYGSISSLEFKKEFMGHVISFYASGNSVKMKWINSGNVLAFVECVQSRLGGKSPANRVTVHPQDDPLEQLKRLGELRQQRVITEQEFLSKKQDLLSRM